MEANCRAFSHGKPAASLCLQFIWLWFSWNWAHLDSVLTWERGEQTILFHNKGEEGATDWLQSTLMAAVLNFICRTFKYCEVLLTKLIRSLCILEKVKVIIASTNILEYTVCLSQWFPPCVEYYMWVMGSPQFQHLWCPIRSWTMAHTGEEIQLSSLCCFLKLKQPQWDTVWGNSHSSWDARGFL